MDRKLTPKEAVQKLRDNKKSYVYIGDMDKLSCGRSWRWKVAFYREIWHAQHEDIWKWLDIGASLNRNFTYLANLLAWEKTGHAFVAGSAEERKHDRLVRHYEALLGIS